MGAKRAYCRAQVQTCWDPPMLTWPLQQWRRRIFEQNSYRRWNVGPSLWARIQKAKYGVETPRIASEEEIQDSTFRGKGDANTFLGVKRPYTGRLPGKGVYNQQCKINKFAGQQSEASSSHQTPRPIVEESVVVAWQFHAHTRPATPLKPVIIWVSRCWNTLPTAQISPLPTTISLDHSKMLYEVVDFLRTKKCGKRCIDGCATKRKPS